MHLLVLDGSDGPREELLRALVLGGFEVHPLPDPACELARIAGSRGGGIVFDVRRTGEGAQAGELAFAGLTLDPARVGARAGARFIELTRTEYQLLALLMLNPRRVLPHALIYQRVWGYDLGSASNALRVYVGYLRRKLREAGAPVTIRTVRGVGYALREA